MEKFPGSDKIKKIAKVAGLATLSLFPREDTQTPELHFDKPKFNYVDQKVYENSRGEKLMPQYYLVNTKKGTPEEIERNIKNKEENERKLILYYDMGRKWVLENINNPDFVKKFSEAEQKSFNDLMGEFTEDFIKEKLGFMNEQASDPDYMVSDDINKSYRVEGGDNTEVGAFYHEGNGKVYFPNELDSTNAVSYAIHEYFHKVNKAGIPLESIKLFSQAFDSLSVVKNLSGRISKDTLKNLIYFSDPSEIYSRKKEFEYEMEKFNIWKYGEKFTFQHYLRAIELNKANKLNSGSSEFIFSIKSNFFVKVMNEIP